jgi:hypothetical protein
MGLFSSKKKVYVSSTVYKIIEDDKPRTSYMQEVIASTALSNSSQRSFADAITAAYAQGPRSNLRAFFRWAKTNFDYGMPRAAIDYNEIIDYAVVASNILTQVFANAANLVIHVQQAFLDIADESYYAEQWLYENRPTLAHLDWAADVDPVTNNIWIQYPPGTEYLGSPISSESFSVPGFDTSNRVLVAYYYTENTLTDETSPARVWIYKIGGSITALNAFRSEIENGSGAREFYPFIPLRINNKSVFETGSPALSKEADIRKAYKKLMGRVANIDDLLDEIEGNAGIGDIDYAYLVPGVSLNTTSKAEKEYLFEFFRLLSVKQAAPPTSYDDFLTANDAVGGYTTTSPTGDRVNVNAYVDTDNPRYLKGIGTADTMYSSSLTNIHWTLPTTDLGVLDMRMSWIDIQETQRTGVIQQGAKVGDVILSRGNYLNFSTSFSFSLNGLNVVDTVNSIIIRKQITRLEYIEIVARGLVHKNLIYKGKSVDITASEALADPDESGFVIPLHEPTLKRLGTVMSTELARESFLIVFNSYQVVKTKWYQKGIFKFILAIILIVVIVVLTVIFAPAGSAAAAGGAGILGSSAAIGASLGFTGLTAIAVGTAANAIAAALVLQLISVGSTAVFGDKLGKLITLVAAVVLTLGSGPGGFSFDNLSQGIGWTNMAAIDKLALMTNAATDLVGVVQQEKINEILEKTQDVISTYNTEMSKLEKLMAELGGSGVVNPMMLTDFTDPMQEWSQMGEKWARAAFFGETPQDFLDRTLLSGGDLIELSHVAISDFVNAALTLP